MNQDSVKLIFGVCVLLGIFIQIDRQRVRHAFIDFMTKIIEPFQVENDNFRLFLNQKLLLSDHLLLAFSAVVFVLS